MKLPGWFKVPTPVGNYNPDWAIVMEDRDGHGDTDERRKITCGEAHFTGALDVSYKMVTSVNELP